MSRVDLISDSFSVIRNAVMVKKEDALIPYSKFLLKICELLKNEGYLENFKEIDEGSIKKVKVYFRYDNKRSAITEIKRVSKPGRRVYVGKKDSPSVLRGHGLAIISTSQGVFTDKEAKVKGLGGEVIGMVW